MENKVPGAGLLQNYKLLQSVLEEEKNSCWRLCFSASQTKFLPK